MPKYRDTAVVYQSGAQAQPTPSLPTRQGEPADDLPHIDVLSGNVRQNITNGKYINLAYLLMPEFDIPNQRFQWIRATPPKRQSHRLDKSLSITQFYQAFGIDKRIMCEAFPQRRLELDLYEADIGNIYQHYGDIFYQYHVHFSEKAAAYMEKGFKVD